MNSKLMGMVSGAMSGAQIGGVPGAVAGAIAGAHPGSPAAQLMSIGGQASQLAGPSTGGSVGGSIGADLGGKATEVVGAEDQDAISRAIAKRQQDPQSLIHQGLKALDDPSLPLDYETRMAAAEPLLRAKYGVVNG